MELDPISANALVMNLSSDAAVVYNLWSNLGLLLVFIVTLVGVHRAGARHLGMLCVWYTLRIRKEAVVLLLNVVIVLR